MASNDLCVEITIPRLGQIWQDLPDKGADTWMKDGLGDFHMGRQGLGWSWVDSYRYQESFPGLVEPIDATGCQFVALIFRSFWEGSPCPSPIICLFPRCGVLPINRDVPYPDRHAFLMLNMIRHGYVRHGFFPVRTGTDFFGTDFYLDRPGTARPGTDMFVVCRRSSSSFVVCRSSSFVVRRRSSFVFQRWPLQK